MTSERLELVVEWADGDRLAAPFPLPPATPTPCEFVAKLGELVTLTPAKWRATWWVQPLVPPGGPRKPAAPSGDSALTSVEDNPTEAPCATAPPCSSPP